MNYLSNYLKWLSNEEGHSAAWGGGGILTIILIVILLILIFKTFESGGNEL